MSSNRSAGIMATEVIRVIIALDMRFSLFVKQAKVDGAVEIP